jgi:hypothetical protein
MQRKYLSLACGLAVAAFASFSLFTAAGHATDDKPADKPADKNAATKTDDSGNTDRSIREQEIYIPYEKLRGVFEKHGRGVFLPYEKFEELWKAARDKTRPAAEAGPPVGAVITDVDNEAVVGKDVVNVTAHVKIDLLTEGWHEVPLRLADAAIVRATIKNEPARVLGGPDQDHRLLIEHKGKQPEHVELTLEYARSIARSPGQNSVSFQAPQAAVSRWKIRIPQAGVKVNLHPLIAATEVPAAAGPRPGPLPKGEGANGETVVLAFVGAAPTVQIDWTPKSEGATGLTALASVQAEQQVSIQEGSTRVQTTLNYTISRAELNQIALEFPADFKVVNVFDPNVRQWSVEPAAAGATAQRITAQLFEPAKDRQSVVVELERIAGQKKLGSLNVPVVKALNAGRQQGFVVLLVSPGLRADPTKTNGLLQVDANELPAALRSAASWTFAYRYASVPFELELSVDEVAPRITVDSLVEARLEPDKLTLDLTAHYTIERAGVFKLDVDVPAGFDIRNVAVRPKDNAAALVGIESYHVEGDKKTHLVVNLTRKALGAVILQVNLQRPMHDANLLTPTGTPAEIDLPLPQVSRTSIEHGSGRLVIAAPESLLPNPAKAEGLRPISFQEAVQGLGVVPSAPNPAVRPVLAFAFTQDPVTLRLSVKRRRPQVTFNQLLVARIDEGFIKYQATFHYAIRYSGVTSLRIDVPDGVKPNNTTQGIHEKTIDPPPPDLGQNMVAWSFSGDGELFGEGDINLTWEKKLDQLGVGKPLEETIPRLVPHVEQDDRAAGQIVLAKAESLDFQEREMKGLRPIDPQRDLTTPVQGAARAFAFNDEWALPITITRYKLDDVKQTSIDRAVCRMVLTPGGETAVQAVYRVRSVRSWLGVQFPPGAVLDSDPARINGQVVTLRISDSGSQTSAGASTVAAGASTVAAGEKRVVPLLSTNADEPFVLELRYTIKSEPALTLPSFTDDTAVQQVYLCAFVPPTRDVVAIFGSWAEDFQWRFLEGRCIPLSSQSDEQRILWVCEGNNSAWNSAKGFHTDGIPLTFSTLRPEAQNSVRLWTFDHQALGGWVFGVVLLIGLPLVRTRCLRRVVVAAFFAVALAMLALFWPTLSLHVIGRPLYTAVAIVLVFWLVVGLFRVYRPVCTAAAGAWSAWRARYGAMSEEAVPPAALPPSAPPGSPPNQEGGQP